MKVEQSRINDALLAILSQIETEDEYVRLQHMKEFKKNNLFWHGFQYLFWSDVDQDWRIPTHAQFEEISAREETKYIYDYVINVFKAHGDSIIAALSSDIPETNFGPRDAQNPNDRRAVDAANRAVELIERWNRAKMLIIQALFLLSTEGFIASYTYNKKSEEYGTIDIPVYDQKEEQTTLDTFQCEACGNVQEMNGPCAECGEQTTVVPGLKEMVPFQTGTTSSPKGREIIEIYGALNVRVPAHVAKQQDAGWLLHYVDADPAQFRAAFPDVAEEISIDPGQDYGRLMRQTSLTMEGLQVNTRLTTQKRVWLRPWMYERLEQDMADVRDELKKEYAKGVYFSTIGEVVCEVRGESMDRHWTITKSGPSKGVHADPILKPMVSIQEQRNNLNNLFTMQVEYGVPATYADTEVFDFQGQARQEVSPGYIYPVTPRPGSTIDSAFYSERTSVLSKEATELLSRLDTDGQFAVGDYPSIHGGPAVSGSKTLGEYEKSRAFALQRLSLVWYFINSWWAETCHKAVISFVEHQIEDEAITSKIPGGWQTAWIRKADFQGAFDRLEPEASSDFPISFGQKRSTLSALLQLNNPEINSVLFSPENAGIVQSYVGLTELVIPGDVQRQKQIREIVELIGLEPGLDVNEQMISPLPIEPEVDDHQIHMDVLRDFLASDAGQDLKRLNPQGYAACLSHLIAHKQAMMATMPLMAPPPQQSPKPKGVNQNVQ